MKITIRGMVYQVDQIIRAKKGDMLIVKNDDGSYNVYPLLFKFYGTHVHDGYQTAKFFMAYYKGDIAYSDTLDTYINYKEYRDTTTLLGKEPLSYPQFVRQVVAEGIVTYEI